MKKFILAILAVLVSFSCYSIENALSEKAKMQMTTDHAKYCGRKITGEIKNPVKCASFTRRVEAKEKKFQEDNVRFCSRDAVGNIPYIIPCKRALDEYNTRVDMEKPEVVVKQKVLCDEVTDTYVICNEQRYEVVKTGVSTLKRKMDNIEKAVEAPPEEFMGTAAK